jgi:hypothetical protein
MTVQESSKEDPGLIAYIGYPLQPGDLKIRPKGTEHSDSVVPCTESGDLNQAERLVEMILEEASQNLPVVTNKAFKTGTINWRLCF